MVQFPYAGVYHKLGRIRSPKETASYSDGVTTFSRQDKRRPPWSRARCDPADLRVEVTLMPSRRAWKTACVKQAVLLNETSF